MAPTANATYSLSEEGLATCRPETALHTVVLTPMRAHSSYSALHSCPSFPSFQQKNFANRRPCVFTSRKQQVLPDSTTRGARYYGARWGRKRERERGMSKCNYDARVLNI